MQGKITKEKQNVSLINGYNAGKVVGMDRNTTYNRDFIKIDVGLSIAQHLYVSNAEDYPMTNRINAILVACGFNVLPVGTPAAKVEECLSKCTGKEVALLMAKGKPSVNTGKRYYNINFGDAKQPVVAPIARVGEKINPNLVEDHVETEQQINPDNTPFDEGF